MTIFSFFSAQMYIVICVLINILYILLYFIVLYVGSECCNFHTLIACHCHLILISQVHHHHHHHHFHYASLHLSSTPDSKLAFP